MQNKNQLFFEVQNLELLAKQVVEGFIIGLHKSPFHGFSVEFAEHRLYNNGEPIKNIDWKVFGRTDKMFVKKFEEETNLRCQLVIDSSSSMFYPEPNASKAILSKIQFSVWAAYSLIYLLKKQRDAFGLSIYNDKVQYHIQAKSSTTHQKLIQHQLDSILQGNAKGTTTNTAACLHEIAENIHKRSLVILFTDFLQNQSKQGLEDLFAALQHLKYNKHEVIIFDVCDNEKELEFDFDNRPYEFVDIETNEKIKLHANQVKEYYTTQIQEYKKQIALTCAQYKIDLVPADINKGISAVLMPYLLKRDKMAV